MALLKVFVLIFFTTLSLLSAEQDNCFEDIWDDDVADTIPLFESLSFDETPPNQMLPRIRIQFDAAGNFFDDFPEEIQEPLSRNWVPSLAVRERLYIQATHKDQAERAFASRSFINLILAHNRWAIDTLYLTNIINDNYPFMVADVLAKLVLQENLDGIKILDYLASLQNQAAYLVDMMIGDLIKDDALKLWYYRSIKKKLYPPKILNELKS